MIRPAHISSLLLLLLAASCSKGQAGLDVAADASVSPDVSIQTREVASATGTKVNVKDGGPIIGNCFSNGNTYSLWICRNNSFEEFNTNTTNILSAYWNGEWTYRHDKGTFDFTDIIVRRKGSSVLMDFYAYSPFISGVTDLTKVPYDVTKQLDLMYAEENSGDVNKAKDVSAGEDIKPVFRFKHSLALIRFKIKNKQAGSSIRLDQIWIKSAEGDGTGTPIYVSGSFNALDGTFSNLTTGVATSDLANKDPKTIITNVETTVYFLICPSECGTNGLDAGFVLNGIGGVSSPYNRFRINRSDLQHDAGNFGLKAGCMYTIYCEIDNYLHMTGVSIKEGWELETMEEKEI